LIRMETAATCEYVQKELGNLRHMARMYTRALWFGGLLQMAYPPKTADDHARIQRVLVARDPRLARVFCDVGTLDFNALAAPPLVAIVSAIVGQQITYVKARAIRKRLYTKLTKHYTSDELLGVTDDEWSEWGLKPFRVAAIRTVAALPAGTWHAPVNWGLVTNVAGIGAWSLVTAKLQCMGDADLWPHRDKFLERKVRKLTGGTQVPDEWTGNRSYVAWYLWRWFTR
jgi:3-methyladenine DNA glycosylase/8-oxoguanine DNA glycosylase